MPKFLIIDDEMAAHIECLAEFLGRMPDLDGLRPRFQNQRIIRNALRMFLQTLHAADPRITFSAVNTPGYGFRMTVQNEDPDYSPAGYVIRVSREQIWRQS